MPRTSPLNSFLNETSEIIDLYLVTTANSVQYYLANYPENVTYAGSLWTGFPINRETLKLTADLTVGSMKVKMANYLLPSGPNSGNSIAQMAMWGVFDNAYVILYQADLQNPASGTLFFDSDWWVQGVEVNRSEITFDLENVISKLMSQTPRRTWESTCNWGLFSTWCTLSRAQWTVYGQFVGTDPGSFYGATTLGVVVFKINSWGVNVPSLMPGYVSSTFMFVNTSNLSSGQTFQAWTAVPGWLGLGQMIIQTGLLSGVSKTIKTQSLQSEVGSYGAVELLEPLPILPSSGDQFTMCPGCGKIADVHCSSKFNNLVNFGGFIYIPNPEVPFGV